jgi:lysophospholipid acyltransferase (LPLAT)-like uncharacterized protein
MKIRGPWAIKWIAFLGSLFIRLWVGTIAFRYRALGSYLDPRRKLSANYLYAFWHEDILVPCRFFPNCGINILVSQHADGEMIARASRHMGFGVVRGSSTRGAIEALRKLLRLSRQSHVAVNPDGPRGPRRNVQLGLVYLAAKTGKAIVPMGFGYEKPWRLRTWDRFVVPRPFAKVYMLSRTPIHVPSDADKAALETYRQQVERDLNELSELAERLARR